MELEKVQCLVQWGAASFWFRRQKLWHIIWKLLGMARLPLQAQRCPSSQPCPRPSPQANGAASGLVENLAALCGPQPPSETSLSSCPCPLHQLTVEAPHAWTSSSPAVWAPQHTVLPGALVIYASSLVHLNYSFLKTQEPEDGPSLLLGRGTNGITE